MESFLSRAAAATLLSALAVPAGAAAHAAVPATADPHASAGAGTAAHHGAGAATGFVRRAGTRLTLDGRPFRFAGANNYYLDYAAASMTDEVLATAQARGLDVVRTWAFLDVPSAADHGDKGVYFQYWDAATGKPAFNDGADGLEQLDRVIADASEHHLKLILPLTNNWSDFGGMDQYTAWAGNTHHSDFFTDQRERTWFRSWIAHLLNRRNSITGATYKDDPTIMAWELANEPRCSGSGAFATDPTCTVTTLNRWVGEMSSYVKSIDPHHLVGTGDEGFTDDEPAGTDWTRNGSTGVDSTLFARNPAIDYVSYHLYPESWGQSADWGNTYIERHAVAARRVGKPAILGEFGLKDRAQRNPVYRSWADSVTRSGTAGALAWMLAGNQADGVTPYPDYDGFTFYDSSPVTRILANFASTMATGERSFAPVADDDVVATAFETAVGIAATGNDVAYGARLRAASLDLDPATAGQQHALVVPAGRFSAGPDGTVTFEPAAGFAGAAKATYVVLDARGRVSNTATITVKVAPSPTAPETLFDFADGTQGWAPMHGEAGGTVTSADQALDITSLGDWFGAALASPGNFSHRTTLSFRGVSTTGYSPILALQVGADWTWCQATPVSWISAPGTVTFDLTTLDDACTAKLDHVDSVQIYLNGGTHVIDDVTVR